MIIIAGYLKDVFHLDLAKCPVSVDAKSSFPAEEAFFGIAGEVYGGYLLKNNRFEAKSRDGM